MSVSRIHVECPDCHGVFDVKAFRVGHRVACKLCGSVVRVPTDSVPVTEAAPEESLRETRPVLKRMSFSESRSEAESDDAIYEDIFDDTADMTVRSRSSAPLPFKFTPQILLGIGVAVFVLLAIFVAYQAGRGAASVPPSPAVPAAPNPTP